MTIRLRRKRNTTRIPPRWRRALFVALAVLVLVGGLFLYDYLRINLWIDSDAGRLEHYPVLLIDKTQEVPRGETNPHEQIDRLLVEEARKKPRNPVTFSRSEIKFNLLRNRVYAKILLETALPDKPDRSTRLRGWSEFRCRNNHWQLIRLDVTTVE